MTVSAAWSRATGFCTAKRPLMWSVPLFFAAPTCVARPSSRAMLSGDGVGGGGALVVVGHVLHGGVVCEVGGGNGRRLAGFAR